MDIYKKIKTDIVAALRGKDKPVLTALRTLDAAILKIVKDKGREINDDLTVEVLKKSIKDIETSKTYAVDAGRQDLIDQADSEISILSEYLPQTLGRDFHQPLSQFDGWRAGKTQRSRVSDSAQLLDYRIVDLCSTMSVDAYPER